MEKNQKKLDINIKTLYFTSNHEWIYKDGESVVIGVTEIVVNNLGPIVSLDLPVEGDEILTCVPFGEIESTETTFDVNSPFEGEVSEVNEFLLNKLDLLSSDPYKKGWLIKITPDNVPSFDSLMNKEQYEDKFGIQFKKKTRKTSLRVKVNAKEARKETKKAIPTSS